MPNLSPRVILTELMLKALQSRIKLAALNSTSNVNLSYMLTSSLFLTLKESNNK